MQAQRKRNWTAAEDETIRKLRSEGATWARIASALSLSRYRVMEHGRRIGAERPRPEVVEAEAPDRPPLPAGHPLTWDLLTSGTVLEGSKYPLPVFLN
ncbi:MAG: AsnC family protein [Proteobacteria bacterium]|nr:AsnC family protein [Pseudomonadota bacterium]